MSSLGLLQDRRTIVKGSLIVGRHLHFNDSLSLRVLAASFLVFVLMMMEDDAHSLFGDLLFCY
jgi:hypothetical protein